MLTLAFTIISALYDTNKRFEDHSSRFFFRAIIVSLISVFEMPTILVGVWKPTLIQFLLNTAIFYATFDYLLNIFELRKWNYVGGTANFDLFFRWFGGWIPQLIFKIIFLIITTILKYGY